MTTSPEAIADCKAQIEKLSARPSLLDAANNGYWQCTKCKHIGEPKNVGEADQQCTNCGKTAVIWVAPVSQGGATDEQCAALESEETDAPVASRVCYKCKQPKFILVAIWVGRAGAKPEDFMCRGCLVEFLQEGVSREVGKGGEVREGGMAL